MTKLSFQQRSKVRRRGRFLSSLGLFICSSELVYVIISTTHHQSLVWLLIVAVVLIGFGWELERTADRGYL